MDDCQEYGEESLESLAIQDQVSDHWSERSKRFFPYFPSPSVPLQSKGTLSSPQARDCEEGAPNSRDDQPTRHFLRSSDFVPPRPTDSFTMHRVASGRGALRPGDFWLAQVSVLKQDYVRWELQRGFVDVMGWRRPNGTDSWHTDGVYLSFRPSRLSTISFSPSPGCCTRSFGRVCSLSWFSGGSSLSYLNGVSLE